ncbi:MAG: hypothetical protein A3C30_00165 [Candidatus Levybacteria bacterium RIFCSPHIGHO2_02_FULL_40_18]|nr:MAG: hypothetical protein A2869_03860 [Candidatus Levybacteria bacterium RIFCSPHIGHO2_01_FULL_40_58]OGH27118.1 MAG: hypothetical protein A3C30_00165 [Candidatus Levybacteria bacterium RIFCSPHIGHO2_02_FULL_40_18]OGH30977.1 MAG: hypothetical protein A3E43_04580 [Candidatus Levybacteria bacterium RIFCSPHIGHO2_12_FULL_40_31]OGH40988.1 MAG: hypothetical protein A2894_01795 [Candidatus Levybacteria bacterium RIFCSPLOWO2_01_FULL_40_64]OGH48935.1 MAG: hypothetical protein A3I54_02760 [Candidatus Lev
MGYTTVAIKGITWIGALRGSTRILAIVRTAILARILAPGDFGLFGIVTLVLSLLEILTETGINIVLVQEKKDIEKYINSAWIVSILRGILIALLILVTAPFVSSFFRSPESLNLLFLISLVPFVRGFINPSVVKFQKELKFHMEFFYSFLGLFTFSLSSIIFALITKDAISLIFGLIISAAIEMIASHIIVVPRPKLEFKIKYLSRVIHRGKWVTLSGILDYLFTELDDIIVGRLMNTVSLGIYQVAYKISTLPISEVTQVFGKVTFPIYVKISSQSVDNLKRAFLRTTLVIFLIVIPFGAVLFFFPREIVLIVLGEKWLAAADVLRILALFGMLKAVSTIPFAIFLAVGKQEYVAFSNLVATLGLAMVVLPLVSMYGLVGAAFSAIFGTVISVPVIIFFTVKILRQKKHDGF